MLQDDILHLIGLAKRAGKLEVGEEPVGASARAKEARLILLAADAASNTYRRAAHFGQAGNVLQLKTPFTKEELGWCVGRTSCAMMALTDTGFASSIVSKLQQLDPEHYSAAAEIINEKNRKVQQRRKEKVAHEKNVRKGKFSHKASAKNEKMNKDEVQAKKPASASKKK